MSTKILNKIYKTESSCFFAKNYHHFSFSKKKWESFVNSDNEDYVSEEAIDLLEKMLVIDHVIL